MIRLCRKNGKRNARTIVLVWKGKYINIFFFLFTVDFLDKIQDKKL